jgi:hypothetical protein
MASMGAAMRRNAEDELVRNGAGFHADYLGATIRKVAYDTSPSGTAVAVVDLSGRVPFDPEVLSAFAHGRVFPHTRKFRASKIGEL